MTDVLGYLQAKHLNLKSADATNVHTTCVYCNEDPHKRGRLYINVDPDSDPPGLHICFRCGAKGNITTLKRHFGDPLTDHDISDDQRAAILEAAAEYYVAQRPKIPEIDRYLTGAQRGLSQATIDERRLGYAPMDFTRSLLGVVTSPNFLYRHLRGLGYETKDILATGLCATGKNGQILDALRGAITIPYLVAGNVVDIRGRTWPHQSTDFEQWDGVHYTPPRAKYKTCGGNQARLYGTDVCWSSDEVIVTEGEFDAMALVGHGFPAVAVPGANVWRSEWDGYFERHKHVWIIFDRDKAGETGAAKLVERLGARAKPVHLSEPGTKRDPTDWLREHSPDDLRELLSFARRHEFLVTVDDAIDQFNEIQGTPGLQFGWELFDDLITPGLQPSQVMIVLAKTNTGKTLLLLNLMQRLRMVPEQKNAKLLFVSLEQTRGEWWDRARRIHRFYNLNSTLDDAAAFWRDNLLLVDRNRITEMDLHRILDGFEDQMGQTPDALFLDYFGYWARSFKGEPYQRASDAIMVMKALAKERGIPVIMPHQVSRSGLEGQEFSSDAARDSGVIEETADLLCIIWSPDNQVGRTDDEKTGRLHMRIAKSRHGGKGALLDMQFAPISLVMVPENDPLAAQARREFRWRAEHRDTWDRAVYRHVTGFEGNIVDDNSEPFV